MSYAYELVNSALHFSTNYIHLLYSKKEINLVEMKPSGLPGFLRRSIRSVDDDDDDHDHTEHFQQGSSSFPSHVSMIPPSYSNSRGRRRFTELNDSDRVQFGAKVQADDLNNDLKKIHVSDGVDAKFRMVGTSHTLKSSIKKTPPAKDESKGDLTKTADGETQTNISSEQATAQSSDSSSTMTREATAPTRNYKEGKFDKILSNNVVDIAELRKLAWNGVPPEHRPQVWKMLLGYLPTNTSRRSQTLKRKRQEYRDAIAQHYDIDDHSRTMQEQETLRQVLVDVPRTAPDVPLFRNDMIRQSLSRLLYIWAMRHPASSYVQGINDLATPLIAVFLSEYFKGDVLQGEELEELTREILNDVEADVYWCLTNLLAGIQDHYTQDQPGVQRMVMRLEELVKRIDVGLTNHLEETGVQFIQFAFRWMNCLLMREFNLQCIIRLWDTYLSEGDGGFETFHVYVCASFLCQFSGDLQGMQFDELFAFMQNIPTNDWDDGKIEIVLSQAFVLSTLFQGSDAHLT